jgi:hypothetical protein
LIGEIHDGELRQLHAQLVDQLQPGHTADPGVADDEIAHLQAERELDGGQPVVGLEDGMAVVEQGPDYEAGDGPVLIGDHDEAAVEAGPGGGIVDLGPGRRPGVAGRGGTTTSIYLDGHKRDQVELRKRPDGSPRGPVWTRQ